MRSPRVDIVLKVEFESVGQLKADFLSNLSTGGMFVRTGVPFAVGQVLNLQLSLPGVLEPPATVEAEVRWVSSERPEYLRGVGLAFKNLSPEVKGKLERMLKDMSAPGVAPPEAGGRSISLALVINNPILQEIIRGELMRLARGGASHRSTQMVLHPVTDAPSCATLLEQKHIDVVVADCDGMTVSCEAMVSALRGGAHKAPVPVIILQGAEGHSTAPPADSRTIVLRKPVGMKALYTTLLALASSAKRGP